jgi:ABC-2 type transport system permease protein
MTGLETAVATEFLKATRSRVPWVVVAAFSLIPCVSGLFMFILNDPERARQMGLLGTKAQLAAAVADWPTFLSLLAQAVAVGGGILFAFLTAWVFGREFSDRTVRGLLALPTQRWAIVTAKTLVIFTWCGAMSLWIVVLGFAIGAALALPGWSAEYATAAIGTILLVAALNGGLQTTTAFVAGAGQGYIPPLAWAAFTIFLAQILTVLGYGAWFPWAVPALVSGAAGPQGESPTIASFILTALVILVSFIATVMWWERADHTL